VIRRGYGQYIEDMHCQKCYNRIYDRLSKVEGVDSMGPHLDKHYIFIRYDANRTDRASIRSVINKAGYTPCNYYSSPKVQYGYYLLAPEQANDETLDAVLALDGVEDVNINKVKKTMAVTFFNDETTADKLYEAIQKAGIKAQLPKPHECTEEKK
jgi:copper chaperone CopZ